MSTELVTVDRIAPAATVPAKLAGEYLSFRLGREEYGIDILAVQEIRGYEAPTHIANAPPFIKGVLDLRGVIVPIVDLRLRFGLGEARYDGQTVTIVLNLGRRVIGVVVDAVSDVVDLGARDIRPAPEFSVAIGTDHIVGLGALASDDVERLLILIDIARLLSAADMGLMAEAMQ